MRIVQVNVTERGGGAEAVALGLHEGFRARGHDATLLVGRGAATRPGVRAFPNDLVTTALHTLSGATRVLQRARGMETFSYPATARALGEFADADIVHLHNLHGGYFDLRVLPALSQARIVTMTLHDAWLLSGHCAHSLGCERWRTGCGACPDLDIYPAVRRDATATNWQSKADIFRRSRLHVAVPSHWLADRVRASMLAPAVAELRVIPNGVDVTTFTPGDRTHARRTLGLPDGPIALLIGSAVPDNPFKDTATALAALAEASRQISHDITTIIVGGAGPDDRSDAGPVMRRPFENDSRRLALHYRAADIYVHAARADTFPTAVLEAMACGTPVVATATGGIPEQVRSVHDEAHAGASDAPTGITTEPGDRAALAGAIAHLLGDEELRARLGRNAACTARRAYDREAQCDAYVDWYRSLIHAGALR